MKKIDNSDIIVIDDASLLTPLPDKDCNDNENKDIPCESISCMQAIDDLLDEVTGDFSDDVNSIMIDAFDEDSETLFMDDKQERDLIQEVLLDGGDVVIGELIGAEPLSSDDFTGVNLEFENTNIGSASLHSKDMSFFKKFKKFFKFKY